MTEIEQRLEQNKRGQQNVSRRSRSGIAIAGVDELCDLISGTLADDKCRQSEGESK